MTIKLRIIALLALAMLGLLALSLTGFLAFSKIHHNILDLTDNTLPSENIVARIQVDIARARLVVTQYM